MTYDKNLHALNIAALNAKWDAQDKKNEERNEAQKSWREWIKGVSDRRADADQAMDCCGLCAIAI